jgi:DNA uptake protein ComE-like DNA-binding protein
MIRKAALAVAVVAALAAAAIFRPPRATPALSYASAGPLAVAMAPVPRLSPRAKSRGRAHRAHQRRSRRHDNVPLRTIDLNRADAATIARIPGVGEWLAQRIVDYRAVVGPFESLDDLSDLDGISATRLASLGRYAVVR